MDNIDLNTILNRNNIKNTIIELLENFNKNKNDLSIKRGIYIYGDAGIGKTYFINNILKELNYDVINYDAGDIRNKSIIDNITKHNIGDKNILSLFNKKPKPIVIVMDEIDGMNSGDKGGINSLIKLIRPKKTKKQKLEEISYNPIICISNYHIDKKINELIKICNSFELHKPTDLEITNLIKLLIPNIYNKKLFLKEIIKYIQGDLRKLESIIQIYNKNNIIKSEIIENIFLKKSLNEDAKEITKNLILNQYSLNSHNVLINDNDRTIVGLLFHENIIDYLPNNLKKDKIRLYLKLLKNICFSDYIDRLTFQKQIWQFNEMSSLLKIFYNNKIFHENLDKNLNKNFNLSEIRFTKILTKYSTEYNNQLFIQNLCQQLNFDIKDLFSFFLELRKKTIDDQCKLLESYDITKLDINRINKYIDKYNYSLNNIELNNIEFNNVEFDNNELNNLEFNNLEFNIDN